MSPPLVAQSLRLLDRSTIGKGCHCLPGNATLGHPMIRSNVVSRTQDSSHRMLSFSNLLSPLPLPHAQSVPSSPPLVLLLTAAPGPPSCILQGPALHLVRCGILVEASHLAMGEIPHEGVAGMSHVPAGAHGRAARGVVAEVSQWLRAAMGEGRGSPRMRGCKKEVPKVIFSATTIFGLQRKMT